MTLTQLRRSADANSGGGGGGRGSVWDRLDKKLLAEELLKRSGPRSDPRDAASQPQHQQPQQPPQQSSASGQSVSIDELLDKRTGITFDVLGSAYSESLWDDEEPQLASTRHAGDARRAPPHGEATAPGGARPPSQQQSRSDGHTQLPSLHRDIADPHRPPHGYRLMDRLKDAQLQRQWRQALGLYCTSVMQQRINMWQPFHFETLFQILADAKRFHECQRLWDAVKAMERPPIDEPSARCLLNTFGRSSSPVAAELAYSVGCFATVRGIEVKGSAAHFFLMSKLRRSSWVEGLQILTEAAALEDGGDRAAVSEARSAQSEKAQQQLRIRDINRLLLKTHDDAAANSLLEAARHAGLQLDAGTYAALVVAQGKSKGWEFALRTLNDAITAQVVSKEAPGSADLIAAVLGVLVRAQPPVPQKVKALAYLGNLLPPPSPTPAAPESAEEDGSSSSSSSSSGGGGGGAPVARVAPGAIANPNMRAVEQMMRYCLRHNRWARACEVFKWTAGGAKGSLEGGSGSSPCLAPSEIANALHIEAMARGAGNSAKIVEEFSEMQRKGRDTRGSLDTTMALINAYSSRSVQSQRRKFR